MQQQIFYFLDLFSLRSDDATSDLTDVCYAFYWEMQMYYPLQLLHISLINQCIVTTNGLALHVNKNLLTSNVL